MRVSCRQLLNFIAETESGIVLGKIIDAEMDVDSHAVLNYKIRGRYRDPFPRREFLVSPREVAAITKDRLIVKDASVSQEIVSPQEKRLPRPATSPSMTTIES